ncbi:hypothetical protein BT93_B3182 [Corymbia citriodora subsp. variegata]|nr:hypothetical protein BT93_B3182 [Corymbia citriodora subsp. variegata]
MIVRLSRLALLLLWLIRCCCTVFLGYTGVLRIQHCMASSSFIQHEIALYDLTLTIVCNKTNLPLLEGISEEDKKLVMDMKAEAMESVCQEGEATNEEGVLLKIEHFDRG